MAALLTALGAAVAAAIAGVVALRNGRRTSVIEDRKVDVATFEQEREAFEAITDRLTADIDRGELERQRQAALIEALRTEVAECEAGKAELRLIVTDQGQTIRRLQRRLDDAGIA